MPWYLPWSESIKKTACRYLLQRYLGQFLEEKLTLDQLTVDLYNGTGTVADVSLDVQALNELGEQQNLPVEFVDGFISEISVSIPWASLLTDSSFVQVSGLTLTIQPKQRADNGTSMFESMWSSMTSSMQLAEECLKQGNKNEKEAEPLEGLELFAQTIDSILSRVKVKFVDTVIRLEHVPKDSTSGVAVEVRIKNIDYLDEAGADPPADSQAGTGETNHAFHIAAFTTKRFCLEGITLFTDEFPSQARTFSRSVMSASTGSTPDSKNSDALFTSAPGSPSQSTTGGNSTSAQNLSLEPDPILCAKLAGRHELRVKLKQAEGVAGPKVDLELNLGSLAAFLSPRQLHVILELMHGLSQPDTVDTSNVARRNRCTEKPMDPADFQRVEQELQFQVHTLSPLPSKGLHNTQTWSSAPLEESDDEFLPMKNRSVGLSESVISSATSMENSACSSVSGTVLSNSSKDFGSALFTSGSPLHHEGLPTRSKKKTAKSPTATSDLDPMAEVSHFQVRLSCLSVVLLHEDVLTLSVDLDGTSLARSSVQQMKSLANGYFERLGLFSITAMGGPQAFQDARQTFIEAVQLNHIRLLATTLILEGREKTTAHTSTLVGQMTSASMELLECLVEKNAPSQNPSAVEYSELLKFNHGRDSGKEPLTSHHSKPDFKLTFQSSERLSIGPSRRYSHPKTDIGIYLEPCSSEVDISIVDRITAVLNPQPMCIHHSDRLQAEKIWRKNQGTSLTDALDSRCKSDGKVDLKVFATHLVIKLRFPTPDLRPIHDMHRPPWWKRCVRDDFLLFNISEARFSTSFDDSRDSTYEILFRDIHGLFQEGDSDNPISFLRAHADDKSGQSLPCSGEGFGWPRLIVRCSPEITHGDLAEIPEIQSEEINSFSSYEIFKTAAYKEPSPFSSKRVIHESDTPHCKTSSPSQVGEGEELVIPGSKEEMADFIHKACKRSILQLEIQLPCATLQFPSKHIYELIYNRVNTDLFLWKPAAPRPKPTSAFKGQDLSAPFSNLSVFPGFSMCKSGIRYESDSDCCEDEESRSGTYYSVYEQRQMYRRQCLTAAGNKNSEQRQSSVTVTISIGQGVFTIFMPVRDSSGNVIPGQQGELMAQLDEGNIFVVSGYQGHPNLGYVCVQLNHAAVFHNSIGPVPLRCPPLHPVGRPAASHLSPTLYRSEAGVLAATGKGSVGTGSHNNLDMVSVALRMQVEDSHHHIKTFRVAAGVRGATLRHSMSPAGHSWFRQLTDFFDILDYPVAGYNPPGVITELHLHFWDCAVDYRPLYLPLKSMLTIGNLSISSNIAAQTKTSSLRFMVEDACLSLAEKSEKSSVNSTSPIDLARDYVCVLDSSLFELSLRLCDRVIGGGPRVDLRASNNMLHIRTCPDSARALMDLLTYFASDGDLVPQSSTCSSGGRPWGSESASSSRTSSSATLREEPGVSSPSTTSPSRAQTQRDTLVQLEGADMPSLSASQVQHVHSLMEEAMLDTNGQSAPPIAASPRVHRNSEGVEVFFFPDESQRVGRTGSISDCGDLSSSENPEMNEGVIEDEEEEEDEEFCILEEETGAGIPPRSGLPEIRSLTPEPIHLLENHFAVPHGKTDLLKAPKHYPAPVQRYTLREMSVIWHMYGGQDFKKNTSIKKRVHMEDDGTGRQPSTPYSPPTPQNSPTEMFSGNVAFSKTSPQEVRFGMSPPCQSNSTSSLTWQARGGPGRRHDILMELQLNKVRCQHEIYPEDTREASRQVMLINEVEVRDRLGSSEINKFLYQYSSEARPKPSFANMVLLKALHIRPDPKLSAQECCLKISLLPVRLNIDQDALLFLYSFFTEISGNQDEDDDSAQSPTSRHATPTHQHNHQPPVMTVNMNDGKPSAGLAATDQSTLLIQLEEADAFAGLREGQSTQRGAQATDTHGQGQVLDDQTPSPPIYFRSFVFTPEVPIKLDYHGKRMDMTHGPLTGILMGLGQLNNSELTLKRLSHRHGLLGFDKLMTYALLEWLQEIKKNQLPSLLGGVGPMHSLVQLFQGFRDLVWLPIEQYQKDGRIVRGLQRGASSFTTSTAMATLELASRLVHAIQCTAETAYDMLSPGPSVRNRNPGPKGKGQRRKRNNQPVDLIEGVQNAYTVVKEGISETAENVVRVASEEHEQKGVTGAVGGVLRQIPGLAVKPVILGCEATHNVLGGMRSQLVPDAHREAVEKWRVQD